MPSIVEFGSVCRDAQRRADILAHPVLNGIDFVEYERRPLALHTHVLVVTFFKPLPDPPNSDPDGAYGLTLPASLGLITILGGTRVVNIRPLEVTLVGSRLEIAVSEEGDFSNYTLTLGWSLQPDGTYQQQIAALDPQFSIVSINFKASCPTDFDCRQLQVCPPERALEPVIDYLAKDYASFRRLLIDLIPQLNPTWLERNPSDLGIALLELFAYEGDNLSYFQDAVANEIYLDTARQRVSAKKHARLIDYSMHDGRNAAAFVHFQTTSTGTVPLGAKILSRVTAPLRSQTLRPDVVIQEVDLPSESFDTDPALSQVRVFETTFELSVNQLNNEIFLHTWGNLECCLPEGTRVAYLYVLLPEVGGERQAVLPVLNDGDFLLLEEVKGPKTGAEADTDPLHRQVVQIEGIPKPLTDPAYQDRLTPAGGLQVFQSGDTALPLLQVTWRRVDALRFPLCLSSRVPKQDPFLNVSLARGNMVLADHGRTIEETIDEIKVPADKIFRLTLQNGPLTMQCQPDVVSYNLTTGRIDSPRTDLTCPVRKVKPAVTLLISFPGIPQRLWEPVPDLLSSPESAEHFAVGEIQKLQNAENQCIAYGDQRIRRPKH